MRILQKLRLILLSVCAVVVVSVPCMSAVPDHISYQGRLTDDTGTLVPDGAYSITFSLYDASDTLLWSETQGSVSVSDGLFSVQIGQDPVSNPFPSFDGEMFLGIKVGSDAEMTPRQALSSVPFAMKADDADTLDGFDSTTFLSSDGGLANLDYNNLLVQGLGSYDASGEEGILYLGDTNSYIKAVHSSGVRIGSWLTGDALAIQQITGNVGIGTVNPTYGKLHVLANGGDNAIYGVNNSNWGALGTTNAGAVGHHDNWNWGALGTTDAGAEGYNLNGHFGVLGGELYGAKGENSNGNYGLLGWSWGVYGYNNQSNTIGSLAGVEGAMGQHLNSGNYGQLGRSDYGAYGNHNSSGHWGALGVVGTGVEGRSTSTNEWHNAIYGRNEGEGSGVYGWSQNRFGTVGVTASTDSNEAGVWAVNNGAGPGIIATAGSGGYAAKFKGNVAITSPTTDELIVEIGEGLDYAEGFDVTGKAGIKPGTVLVIDPHNPGRLSLSSEPYDTKVAGIVAGANSLGSGVRLGAGQFDHNVALAGRVYCNVETAEVAIAPGDLLTTSPIPGYAMKVLDSSRAQGAILGKAMQGLAKGETNQILVLVTLQ